MRGRRLRLFAGLVLVLGFAWSLVRHSLPRSAGDGLLPADLVIDGQPHSDGAAFFGMSGSVAGVSVEALVGALGGSVERAGQKSETEWEYAVITLKGRRLVLHSGQAPQLSDPSLIFVNETGRRTDPDLGWYWTTPEVKDYLKIVYPRVVVATAFSRTDRAGRGVFIETEPVQ